MDIDASLPVFSSRTVDSVASVVASPVDTVTVGLFLYPKPTPVRVAVSSGNPTTAVPAPPDPVVS